MVYEQLLSVHGLSRPEHERVAIAQDLATELRAINEECSGPEEVSYMPPDLLVGHLLTASSRDLSPTLNLQVTACVYSTCV